MTAQRRSWKLQGQSGLDLTIERDGLIVTLKATNGEAVFPDGQRTLLPVIAALDEAWMETRALKYAVEGDPAMVRCHQCGCDVFVEKLDHSRVFCKSTKRRECHEYPSTWHPEKRRREVRS